MKVLIEKEVKAKLESDKEKVIHLASHEEREDVGVVVTLIECRSHNLFNVYMATTYALNQRKS